MRNSAHVHVLVSAAALLVLGCAKESPPSATRGNATQELPASPNDQNGGQAANASQWPPPSSRTNAGTETSATMTSVTIPIEGMSCAACAARVKKALTAVDGVGAVQVNLAERNARIEFAGGKVSVDQLVSAINGTGFKAKAPSGVP